jgi:hypothetical protein
MLAVIHGVDGVEHPSGAALMRCCAGVIIQNADAAQPSNLALAGPLFVPGIAGEVLGTVGARRFPHRNRARGERAFDIYFGMADYEIGRDRLVLCPENGPRNLRQLG